MKRLISFGTFIIIALSAISCAKTAKIGPNDAHKRYFEAWLQVNDIKTEPSGRGIYVLEETQGIGKTIEENGFVFMDYTTTDLDGNISSYTTMQVAKQLGAYNDKEYTTFYGPQMTTTYEGNIYAGLADMLIGMQVGGKKKAIIPSWLLSYDEYEDESDYLAEATSNETIIYDVAIKDFTTDIVQWEIDSIGRFFSNEKLLIDGIPANKLFVNKNGWTMTAADSLQKGFYYTQLKSPESTESFAADTTIYINYTGRLLNGQVFDTTLEDVAKDNRIYSSSKTYEPVQINWINTDSEEEDYTDITMGSDESSVISGFARTIWQMKAMEKGIGIFYSPLGYSYSGSGSTIPAYSPLIFEIEIVAKPED